MIETEYPHLMLESIYIRCSTTIRAALIVLFGNWFPTFDVGLEWVACYGSSAESRVGALCHPSPGATHYALQEATQLPAATELSEVWLPLVHLSFRLQKCLFPLEIIPPMILFRNFCFSKWFGKCLVFSNSWYNFNVEAYFQQLWYHHNSCVGTFLIYLIKMLFTMLHLLVNRLFSSFGTWNLWFFNRSSSNISGFVIGCIVLADIFFLVVMSNGC